jgi:hypothetical protein
MRSRRPAVVCARSRVFSGSVIVSAPGSHLGGLKKARKRQRVRCSSLVYLRLPHTMQASKGGRNAGACGCM